MAHGSTDYWLTQSNWMSELIEAIKLSVSAGGTLIEKLDNLDGKADGRLDLSVLTNAEAGVIAKLLGLDADLKDEGDLLTKLDNLDGKADGKLDISKLTAAETGLLAKLFTVDQVDSNGKNLLEKLDALDGKADGKLDMSSLTSAETGVLHELGVLDADLKDDGNLLNKLDNLDGKADGILDLNKLKTMDIFYNGAAEKSRLEILLAELTTAVGKLTDVVTNTLALSKSGYMGFTTSPATIIDDPGTMQVTGTFWTHPDNTANIGLSFYDNGSIDHTHTLTPGTRYVDVGLLGHVAANSSSGTQLLAFVVS